MFSLDLSLELINMVNIAAGVVLLLLNMAAMLAPGPLLIWMELHGSALTLCANDIGLSAFGGV